MRRVIEACSSLSLPRGFHLERVQWLYDGVATTTAKAIAYAPPVSPSRESSESGVSAVQKGSKKNSNKKYLLYWMQTSVRARYNYSLEYAVALANALSLPLHVVYMLSDRSVVPPSYAPRDPNAFGVATERHAKFALEGLECVAKKLEKRGLNFQVFHHHHEATSTSKPTEFWAETDDDEDESGDDPTGGPSRSDLLDLCARDAALVITDRPYLRPHKDALAQCVEDAKARSREWGIVQVEGDVVVPCEQASTKEEYAARTIRPKVQGQLKKYLVALDHAELKDECRTSGVPLRCQDEQLIPLDVLNPSDVLKLLDVDRSVPGVSVFLGGEDVANQTAKSFFEDKLTKYATDRNEPSGDGGSNLSLYLRHGHISPVRIALQANKLTGSAYKDGKESFLEEMIVRRELAVNMCVFNEHYDTMDCLPEYATITLKIHAEDTRDHLYDVHELEQGKTFDVYWNAAQLELVHTGRMHGYMRMYWCKKILEWTESPQLGFRIALYLNNKYGLDAPDPNSYTGVAWSFGKHDQGWKERPIFGKVRYMNEAGLKRKFRMDAYVAKIKKLHAAASINNPTDAASSPFDGFVAAAGKKTTTTKTTKSATTKASAKKAITSASATTKATKKTSTTSDGPTDEEDDIAASMAKKRKALDAFFASKKQKFFLATANLPVPDLWNLSPLQESTTVNILLAYSTTAMVTASATTATTATTTTIDSVSASKRTEPATPPLTATTSSHLLPPPSPSPQMINTRKMSLSTKRSASMSSLRVATSPTSTSSTGISSSSIKRSSPRCTSPTATIVSSSFSCSDRSSWLRTPSASPSATSRTATTLPCSPPITMELYFRLLKKAHVLDQLFEVSSHLESQQQHVQQLEADRAKTASVQELVFVELDSYKRKFIEAQQFMLALVEAMAALSIKETELQRGTSSEAALAIAQRTKDERVMEELQHVMGKSHHHVDTSTTVPATPTPTTTSSLESSALRAVGMQLVDQLTSVCTTYERQLVNNEAELSRAMHSAYKDECLAKLKQYETMQSKHDDEIKELTTRIDHLTRQGTELHGVIDDQQDELAQLKQTNQTLHHTVRHQSSSIEQFGADLKAELRKRYGYGTVLIRDLVCGDYLTE